MALAPDSIPSARLIVAANVRARMAWLDLPPPALAVELGCTQRTLYNKLLGIAPFKSEELDTLARLFDMDNPGLLYEVPDGFPKRLFIEDPVRNLASRRRLPRTFTGFAYRFAKAA